MNYQPKTTKRIIQDVRDNGKSSDVIGYEVEEGTIEGYRFMVRAPLTRAIFETVKTEPSGMIMRHAYWSPIFSLPERMAVAELEKLFIEYWRAPQQHVAGEGFKGTTSMCLDGIAGVLQGNEFQKFTNDLCVAQALEAMIKKNQESDELWAHVVGPPSDTKKACALVEGAVYAGDTAFVAGEAPRKMTEDEKRRVREVVEQLHIGCKTPITFGGVRIEVGDDDCNPIIVGS